MKNSKDMKEFSGKKLLILGGTTLSINIVETAKNMGIYTIVMDMSPDSPTKKVADKAYDISTATVSYTHLTLPTTPYV